MQEAEDRGASGDELLEIIGIGKTKVGIYDGDVENGEVEIGQVTGLLKGREIEPVEDGDAPLCQRVLHCASAAHLTKQWMSKFQEEL